MRAILMSMVLMAGCVVDSGRAAPTPMEVSRECVAEETCGDRQAQCFEDRRLRCESCTCEGLHWNLVGACLESCNRICTDPCPTCTSDSPTHCTDYEFVARLPDPRDENIYESCSAALDVAIRECGRPTPESDICDTYARVERPEVAGWYDCAAASPCEDVRGCSPDPDRRLVDHVCNRDDVECPEDFQEMLAHGTPWLKDDVVAALIDCDQYTTTDRYLGCVQTWVAAVFPR